MTGVPNLLAVVGMLELHPMIPRFHSQSVLGMNLPMIISVAWVASLAQLLVRLAGGQLTFAKEFQSYQAESHGWYPSGHPYKKDIPI